MVKGYLLVLKKISLIDASFAFLSDDDSAEDEALIVSSLKVKEVKEVEKAEAVKAAKI